MSEAMFSERDLEAAESLLWLRGKVQTRAAERARDEVVDAVNAGQYEPEDDE